MDEVAHRPVLTWINARIRRIASWSLGSLSARPVNRNSRCFSKPTSRESSWWRQARPQPFCWPGVKTRIGILARSCLQPTNRADRFPSSIPRQARSRRPVLPFPLTTFRSPATVDPSLQSAPQHLRARTERLKWMDRGASSSSTRAPFQKAPARLSPSAGCRRMSSSMRGASGRLSPARETTCSRSSISSRAQWIATSLSGDRPTACV